MKAKDRLLLPLIWLLIASCVSAPSAAVDPRLREATYNPNVVIPLPVKRGVVTLLSLDADESISEVASGLGGDCNKPESAWCIAVQPGGRNVFVKPKASATGTNNLLVITDKRTHTFQLVLLADDDPRPAVFRMLVKSALQPAAPRSPVTAELAAALTAPRPALPSPSQIVQERLLAKPAVTNSNYSLAQGPGSDDILPEAVFDDGRFTYLRFSDSREVPAVFHVMGDGEEALVNTRLEDDLLVVDRVSRRLVLRAGAAVVGIWNETYNAGPDQPSTGATVPGVMRVVRQTSRAMEPRP